MVNTYSLRSLPCNWSKGGPHCFLQMGNGKSRRKEWADTLNGPMNLSLSLSPSLAVASYVVPTRFESPKPVWFPSDAFPSRVVAFFWRFPHSTPLHSAPLHSTHKPLFSLSQLKRSKLSVQTLTHFSRRSRRMMRMRRAKP